MAVLVLFAVFILFLVLFIPYWQRIVDGALTNHFRAAESIADGHLPQAWAKQIERQLRQQRWHPLFRFRHQPTGTALALAKLEQLTHFFTRSTFFADDEAKAILLAQLKSTGQHWEKLSWEELQKDVLP